jgi:ankyrin repeat protein
MKLEEQWCSLHYATIEGNYEACKILLNSGAKPDVTNI